MFGHVEIDGQRTTLAVFLFPRGYSRATYVEFVTDLSTPTFLRCHQNAFDYFGGFPKEILYDNLKSVVLRRAYLAAQSQFHPLFLNFAAYYPFSPRLCHPYRPATKGKVEDWVQFVRKNFFEGRHFSSLQELNHRARLWCNEVHQRVHGTTHVPPIDRLELERLPSMVGRPHCPIVQTFARRVSRDCFVRFISNKYSIPWKYAGREEVLCVVLRASGVGERDLLVQAQRLANEPFVAELGSGPLALVRRNGWSDQSEVGGMVAHARRDVRALEDPEVSTDLGIPSPSRSISLAFSSA